jgi:excisionase family DNA binding protein
MKPLACTVTEAAQLVGKSKWTIYDAIKREQFPAARFGRTVLIPIVGIAEFLGDSRENVLDALEEIRAADKDAA